MAKNIIFLINIEHDKKFQGGGNTLKGAFEWSIKSWESYAERWGCDIFVLDQPLMDIEWMKPNWFKMYILDILEANEIDYDQVLYVDYDTIVTPDAPNIFELTDHKFTAVRNYGDMDWVCRSIENYSKFVFDGFTFPYYNYFNSGVMVFNKKHKELFKGLQEFYQTNRDKLIWMQNTYCVGNDQPVFNFFVNQYIPVDYKVLGYEWNMQDMMRFEVLGDDMLHTRYGYVSHYNAGTPPSSQYWIEKTYKHLYENN
jgi:lipopolysaccharide biosynthesis glycosyltransferase